MLINFITHQLPRPVNAIENVISLLNEGATVPFIARYRKEMIIGLGEEDIFQIKDLKEKYKTLEARKAHILSSIKEQGKLTPLLEDKIIRCLDLNTLEDLFLPFKKKRKTKAESARQAGLEPLAKIIMAQNHPNILTLAKSYINQTYSSKEAVIEGAQYIIAEWISEDLKSREILRDSLRNYGFLKSTVIGSKKLEAEKYKDYWEYQEKAMKAPSHRVLAIFRGSNEGLLRCKLDMDLDRFYQGIIRFRVKRNSSTAGIIETAIRDSIKRLLFPSVENQVLNELKEKAEKTAAEVFANNLRQLLLSPPLGEKSVLALDPGFRTGCKLVCLDATGGLLTTDTIFPHAPQNRKENSIDKIFKYLDKYSIENIAIGDGTAGRETQEWLGQYFENAPIQIYLVNEDGASIYSASEIARKEFPNQDITVRGSVSIGRRLIDPLSELVKIDPKSIGVGQYQHDISTSLLKETLDNTVVSAVNKVGINLNTASEYLLQYISGLGPTTAKKIIEFRDKNGSFTRRSQLMKVARMGSKSYEQAVGFLRVRNDRYPLDNSGIHPESYHIVEQMASDLGVSVEQLMGKTELIKRLNLAEYVSAKIGLPTLQDIVNELQKPGHDPRGKVEAFTFNQKVRSISDLKVGMVLPGIISNITNFGAFVNIGLKQDGLIHISQITDRYISDPAEILTLQQKVRARVLAVDEKRGRINLTLKS